MIKTVDSERDRSLLADAFDAVDDGLIVLDGGCRVVAANAAALRDLGYAADDLVGRRVGLILPDPVHQHTTERREYRSLRTYLARHDRATGCLNRFGVEDLLDQLIESRPESQLAVVYLDLNGLMTASDSYPSGVAAELVAQAVTRLRGALRDQDRLARVGRHEFVAVVVLDAAAPSVGLVAQRLSACLQAPLEAAAWRVPVRASVGLSLYPEHARTPDRLIDRAEAAMRRAKRSATQQAQLYSVEDQRRDEARDEYLERVRLAAERHEFTLYYQPQFELTTLRTTGLEALLRWHHPEEGLLSPGEFLSLVAECGLMPTVSRWVLHEAVALNTQLIEEGILDVPVAVNIGPEIFEDRGFVDLVTQVLAEHGMAADRLEIEITEATAITDPAQVAANASALRSLGVGIAIDDFGTGFSSLRRLRLADFSKLKIDRTFVSLLPGDIRDQGVITGLLDLANVLDMDVVAEGIETEEQLRTLRRLGCREGQGYWHGRPMAEDVLRAWIGMQR